MKRFISFLIFGVVYVSLSLGGSPASFAQSRECLNAAGATSLDQECLDQVHLEYCNLSAEYDDCGAWLEELTAYRDGTSALQYNLHLGMAHQMLSVLTNDENVKETHVAEARRFYDMVLGIDSNNVDARYGIAAISEPGVERVEQLQRILEVEPDNAFAGRQLAQNIRHVSGDTEIGNREAAVALESVFDGMDDSLAKWNIAELIYRYFERSGLTDEMERYKQKVINVVFPDDRVRKASELEDVATGDVASSIETLCNEPIVGVIGSAFCLESLDLVLAAISETGSGQDVRSEYIPTLSNGVVAILNQPVEQYTQLNTWRSSFVDRYISTVIDPGTESGLAYFTLSMLLPDGHPGKFDAISRALEFDGDSVRYNMALGSFYMETEEYVEAIDQYERTLEMDSLSEPDRVQIEGWISVAEDRMRN